jgi:hypothetical protein
VLNYLLRTLWGIYQVEFEAHILLPGVFLSKAEDPESLLAKAKATFMELAARYGQRFAPVQFAQLLISRSRKPFTKMYIYDILNTEAAIASSRHQLAQIIKLVWQTINFGPVAASYRGLLERVRSEHPRVFSAAGIFVKEFPVEWIIRLLGLRLAAEFVEHHFLYTWPPDEARATAGQLLTDFLNRHPELRALPAFRLDDNKRPRRVDVKRFKSLPRKLIPQAVQTYMLQTLAAWQSGLEQQAQAEALKQSQVIARELEAIINRRGGLDLARYFLLALDAHQERLKHQASRELGRARGRSVGQPAASGKLRWLTQRRDYLERNERVMIGQADQQTLIAGLAYANQLRTLIEGYQQMLAGWLGSLAELYERLLATEARLVDKQQAQRSVVVESVVKDEDIDQFFNEGKADALEMITEGLHMSWLADEGKFILEYLTADQPTSNDRVSILSPEGIARHVEYCQQAWHGLRELSIEQILRDRGEDPLAVAAELEQKALPWVAVKEVKQIPPEQKLLLLGTETGESGFWRGYGTKLGIINFVATGDRTRIVFLYTAHGLDVFNLRQAAAWDYAYDQAIQEGKPLHVVPELDPLVNQQHQEAEPVDETAEQSDADESAETEPVPVPEEQAV